MIKEIMLLNNIDIDKQNKEKTQWELIPIYDYFFDKNLITKYELRKKDRSIILHISSEQLFNIYLKDLITKIED